MKAWGEGKLKEYLAPDLAKLDAAEAPVQLRRGGYIAPDLSPHEYH